MQIHKKLLAPAGLLLMVALSSNGCGESSPGKEELTKKQFLKRAAVICVGAEREKIRAGYAYATKHPHADEASLIKPVLLPPLEKQIQGLKALSPPKGDEAEIDRIVTAYEEVRELARRNPKRFVSMRPDPFRKAIKLAVSYDILWGCDNAP